MNAPARVQGAPARFAADPHKRAMIAKVHIAKADLGLDEDTYRQIIFDHCGVMSAADASSADLAKVLDHFKAHGWKPLPAARKAGAVKARPADSPMARKARAMWISLHQLGVVRDPSEKALERFAAKQLKCERMAWADQGKAYKLIEALKAMAKRHGWNCQVDHVADALKPQVLKQRLCEAILAKLKAGLAVPQDWTLDIAAARMLGIVCAPGRSIDATRLDIIAKGLSAKLADLSPQEPEA